MISLMPSLVPLCGTFSLLHVVEKDPQKGIKKCKIHCTHGGLVHTSRAVLLPLARYPQILTPTPLSKSHSDSAPLCSCSGTGGCLVEGIKNPEGHRGTSGLRFGNELRSSSALPTLLDVAPFPSHRRSRLLMRHLRNALVTIRHQRRHDNRLPKPRWAAWFCDELTPHPLVPRGLSPPGARQNVSRPFTTLWGLPRPARGGLG